MGKIFISYRRDDSSDSVQELYTLLTSKFGPSAVFRDQDTLRFGANFVYAIETHIQYSSVMLVIIGPKWLTIRDANGNRRLDTPSDYVRQEIEMALAKHVETIPVLVQGASMPTEQSLPQSLATLATLNAAKFGSAADAENAREKLFAQIEQSMKYWTPPSGPEHAIGAVEGFHTIRELRGRVEVDVTYMSVSFFNPITNQEDHASIRRQGGYAVGDLVKIRLKAKWFGLLGNEWVMDG